MVGLVLDSVDVPLLAGALGHVLAHLELGLVNPLLLCELLAADSAMVGRSVVSLGALLPDSSSSCHPPTGRC